MGTRSHSSTIPGCLQKSDRIEDLLVIGTPECARAAYRDLFYPVRKADSRISPRPLHLRQKVLLVLRKAYPDEKLFQDSLIDQRYTRRDSLAIARYLEKVAAWGKATFGEAPGDTLGKAFIAFPVPGLRP